MHDSEEHLASCNANDQAFVAGKEWVPERCHTYLHVDNATAEASTYVSMAKTIAGYVHRRRMCSIALAAACLFPGTNRECDVGAYRVDAS